MNHLIDYGYVRSKTEGKGKEREEKFYLSNILGGGSRKRRNLQGRGIINDTSRLIKRLTGSFFFLVGLGFIGYEIFTPTGAVISSGEGFNLTSLFSFLLLIIGGFLFKNSLGKKEANN